MTPIELEVVDDALRTAQEDLSGPEGWHFLQAGEKCVGCPTCRTTLPMIDHARGVIRRYKARIEATKEGGPAR